MWLHLGSYIREHLASFSPEDKIIFNSSLLPIDPQQFVALNSSPVVKSLTFIDGGQAEIINGGNFCLSFIRVAAVEGKKVVKNEFYLFTKAIWKEKDIFYESLVFPLGEKIVDERDLYISSNDSSLKRGKERASISRVVGLARRFAELQLAASVHADYVLLDGTLEPTLKNEEKYIARLPPSASALAKTCSLFTTSGNNPVVMLNKVGGKGCWRYHVENKTYFVKLHENAKHVFRFEGNPEVLPYLLNNSQDALFLGYPYGLILADQLARVSNEEKKSLRMNFLLRKENKEILNYLNATNAHEILDGRG